MSWIIGTAGRGAGVQTIDSDYLYRLAREKSAEGRAALAEAMADLFHERRQRLTDREWALMTDILHRVVLDVEASIRRNISAWLADLPEVPRDLVRLLANDEIEIAYPILTRSRVLEDSDLIEVVLHRTLEHQLAIALRPGLSEQVSDALVAEGRPNVIVALLSNADARISRDTMAYLVDQSRREDAFREPILSRRDLDPALAKRMFLWVSAALRRFIVEHWKLDPETVDNLLEKAIRGEQRMAGAGPDVWRQAEHLAADLEEIGTASAETMVEALEAGEVPLFIAIFRKLTGLRMTLAKRIVFEPGGEGLAIACKAIGLDKMAFATVYTLTRQARPAEERDGERESGRVFALFQCMSGRAAGKVLKTWQRNAEYLAAVREIDAAAPAAARPKAAPTVTTGAGRGAR